MASTSQGTNLSGQPMAARSGAQPKRWGLGAKVGVGVLCVALIAAVAIGLGVGLSNRDDDDSPTAVSQGTAGSATASRNDGTQSGTVAATGSGEGTSGSGTSGGTNSTNDGTCGSILDVVAESPELSTLLSLLQVTGLNETLSDDELEYTLLAPSNSVLSTVSPVPPVAALTNILQLHVVTSSVSAASLVDGAYLPTVTGGFLNVSLSEGSASFVTADGASNATVIEADLKSCKGYVHVIDNILLTAELKAGLGPPGSGNTTVPGETAVPGGNTTGTVVNPGNTTLPSTVPSIGQGLNVTRGEDGKYTVCSGRWAPQKFQGPEPCGIRVRSTGVVNIGTQYAGDNGYFSIDAADGLDDPCFKASVAAMFGQKLCQFKDVEGGVECLTEADGSNCICLAPLGKPAMKENNRKWDGNIDFNRFLKIVRSRANLEDSSSAAVLSENKAKTELSLQEVLNIVNCAAEVA